MINGEIFLEKTVMYTLKKKFFMKLILLVEYLIIFIETIKSVTFIFTESSFDSSLETLYYINWVNPYYFFSRSLTCSATTNGQTICTFSSNMLFYLAFGVYFLIYALYKFKYEKTYRESDEYLEKENGETVEYLDNPSKIQYLIINYFNTILRPFSIFIFFINFNVLISSILNIIDLGTLFNINFLLVLLSLCFSLFSIIFDYQTVKGSSLMFGHNELQSHFDSFFSIKYDFLMIVLKVLISINNNLQMMSLYTGQLRIFLNLLIVLTIIIFALIFVSDVGGQKVIIITNFNLNYLRLLFVNYNSIFLIFLLIFFENHKNVFLMMISLVFNLILSIFLTNYMLKKNEINIMTDKKLVYMLIYLFEISNEGKKTNEVSVEFAMRHRKSCRYYQKVQNGDLLENDHDNNEFECYICQNDDPEGIRLSTIKLQMKYNKKSLKMTLNKKETRYYKLLKLFMKNSEEDIISLVYKTNKILAKSDGQYKNFIKLFYNMISFKGKNQESLKRYTDIKKTFEVTNLISEVIKNLFTTYDTFKFVNCEIYNMAEKLAGLKYQIFQKLTSLLSKSKNKSYDNYAIIIQKYIFESLFNDESLFKGERNFYDYEEYLTSHFEDNKTLEICYDYPKNSLHIINAPFQFVNYYNTKFETIFPSEIQLAQKEKFINLIQKTTSNNFDFECFIKNVNDPHFISKARFSCTISYSLEMSEFLIQAKYHILEEEIIMGMEERNQISILGCSQNLGKFLLLSSDNIRLYRKFGFRVSFEEIFKFTSIEHQYEFSFSQFYSFYFKLGEDLMNQYQYEDTLKMLEENYKSETPIAKPNMTFKIVPKGTIRNFIFYSVQSELNKEKETIEKTKTMDQIHDYILQDNTTSNSSTQSYKDCLSLERGMKINGRDKNQSQEKINTDKLKLLSNSLGIFSVLVILYCVFFMVTGIINNLKMNQLFLIESSYDTLERSFYHTTTNLLNVVVVLDQGKSLSESDVSSDADYFLKMAKNKNITFNILDFYRDDTFAKANDMLNIILNFEIMISTSYYQTTLNTYFSPTYDYYSFSNVGGNFRVVVNTYSLFDSLKIYMNNVKMICNDVQYFRYIYLTSFNNGKYDFSNIISISDLDFKMYEIIINYVNLFKILDSLKTQLDKFNSDSLNSIFSQSFYLSYLLMAIHFLLVIISVLLIMHLKNIMKYNIFVISNLIKDDNNFKLMKRKLEVLKTMNMFYCGDPNVEAKKLNKIRKELETASKASDKKQEKSKKVTPQVETIDNVQAMKSLEDFKQLSPIVKLMIFLLSIYYAYSLVCIMLLKTSSSNITIATDFFKLNSEKFKRLLNSQNLLEVSILTNRTGPELYTEILGTNSGNVDYIEHLRGLVFEDWKNINYYQQNYLLFSSVNTFYQQDITCDYLYYNTNDTIFYELNTLYTTKNSTMNFLKSLSSICQMLNVITNHDSNLVEEEIIYDINKLDFQYKQTEKDYVLMKELYNSDLFNDVLNLLVVIMKPLQSYLSDIVLYSIELSCFQSFLMYSMIYLCLNIIVDFTILVVFNNFIIKRIKMINDNLIDLLEVIKIY